MSTLGTILVAEDDTALAALLIEVLAEEGYVVQLAAVAPMRWRRSRPIGSTWR
jgi:DNA-binding response OmpR family regulator